MVHGDRDHISLGYEFGVNSRPIGSCKGLTAFWRRQLAFLEGEPNQAKKTRKVIS